MIVRVAAFLLLLASLPALAQTPAAEPHGRCLTPLFIERQLRGEKLDPALQRILDSFCSGPSDNQRRPIKQRSVLSSAGHFRTFYDTDGDDAVALVDRDGNTIPDYVDSVGYWLEYAWTYEVNTLGYAPPPPENRGPGPEIEVYICDLRGAYYGGAQPEDDNIVGTDPLREHGYMILDNDYANYKSPPMASLRVTTAHELHHIIQFSAYRTALAQVAFYEATSTWMEEEVHPDVDDWTQYVDEFLRSPQDYGFSTHNVSDFTTGYAHMLYMEYVEKRFGRNAIREFWEEFRTRDCFPAMDLVLSRRNFNLSRSWCEFAEWCYYTGYRARDTMLLRQAPGLPALRPAEAQVLSQDQVTFTDFLYPLSFGLYRVLVPSGNVNLRDTVDFLVSNCRSNIGAGGPSIRKDTFSIDVSSVAHADYIPLRRETGDLYYRLVPLRSGSADVFCIDAIDDSVRTSIAVRTSPQPFINRSGEQLLFAVGSAEEIRRVRVRIYGAGMTLVADIDQAGLKSRDNQLGLLWDGLDENNNRAPSGVYIYEMEINDTPPAVIGKFAVVQE